MADQERIVLISAHFNEQWLERFRRIAPDMHFEIRTTGTHKAIPDALWQNVEVMYTFGADLPTPEQAPHLQWVQLYSAGANQVMPSRLYQETSVRFTTASGVHAVTIGEYVLMVMLAWFHQLPLLLSWQQQGLWPRGVQRSSLFKPQEIRGKTIGIIGYGSIGREVARLAKASGMRVLAVQRGSNHRDSGFVFPGVGDPAGTLPDHYYTLDQLQEMVKMCDVVLASLPLTSETHHVFNADIFKVMKPDAFFVNIARGDVVDEAALIRALEEKQIAGAALDVFHQEPLPADSPLWKLPNVILSPHITGLFSQYDEMVATIFEENFKRYLKGESLYNLVDKERGY
jgi:phosphoglycerate dehydrogenase-like enzyme